MRKRRCGESQQKHRSPQEPYTVVFQVKKPYSRRLQGEVSQTLVDMYTNVHREFAVLSPEKQVEELSGITSHHVLSMINYIYDHFDEFKLLLCCGAPGSAEAFIARLAGVEEQSCFDFVEAVKSLGYQVPELDDTLVHILCRSFFQQLQEFISHDLPRERALSCALLLGRFQHAGWVGILNL